MDQSGTTRVTVEEAARLLGIEKGSVKKRIQRGKLRSERDVSGTVYVHVDRSETVRDESQGQSKTGRAELLESKDETITILRDQLHEEREARRRADTIIAQLARTTEEQARTIRELEAPQEASEAAETIEEAQEGAEPHSAEGEAREELSAERARREMAETTMHEGMAEERRRREAAERERDELRRQLFARREPQGSPQTVEEAPDRDGPGAHFATGGAQEGARRPWWRRIVGR
jgi:excisionase family DNA binding protein